MLNPCRNTDMLSYVKRAMKITDIFYDQHNKGARGEFFEKMKLPPF